MFPDRGSGGLASPRRGALSNKTGSTLTLEVWNVSTRRIVILSPMSLFHAPGPTFFKSMGNFALNTVPTDKCLLDQSENAGSSTAVPRSPTPPPPPPHRLSFPGSGTPYPPFPLAQHLCVWHPVRLWAAPFLFVGMTDDVFYRPRTLGLTQ